MNLICPWCGDRALKIEKSLELGYDARNDEYSLQAVYCPVCGMGGVAIYEESRRGAEDSWYHYCHHMKKEDYELFLKQLSQCPDPKNDKCNCSVHTHFNQKEANGTLYPLGKLTYDSKVYHIKI